MDTIKCRVCSEVEQLRAVVVHLIDKEWDLVPADSRLQSKYLLEDIVYLEKAQEEQREFFRVLELVTDHSESKPRVLEFTDLLGEILRDKMVRHEVISAVCALENVSETTRKLLLDDADTQDPLFLSKCLIRGAIIRRGAKRSTYTNLFDPIPNLIFTRDIGAVVGSEVVNCRPANKIRQRETLLADFVFANHRIFSASRKVDIYDAKVRFWVEEQQQLTIEGGDIIVLGENTIMIGCGQRTNYAAAISLLNTMADGKKSLRALIVNLSKERRSMHLDTIFTLVADQEYMIFERFVDKEKFAQACEVELWEHYGSKESLMRPEYVDKFNVSRTGGIFHAFGDTRFREFEPRVRLRCGGPNVLFQIREQWTDGANLFAIRPHLVVGYDRNIETSEELRDNGYDVMPAGKFMDEFDRGKIDLRDDERKIAVTIRGTELSRGRGGARCMTMPIWRER